jgi:hypothetical protein
MSSRLCPSPNLIRLDRAALCADCEVISETKNGRCAACGSQALLGLSRVLGGSIGSQMTFQFAGSAAIVSEALPVALLAAA